MAVGSDERDLKAQYNVAKICAEHFKELQDDCLTYGVKSVLKHYLNREKEFEELLSDMRCISLWHEMTVTKLLVRYKKEERRTINKKYRLTRPEFYIPSCKYMKDIIEWIGEQNDERYWMQIHIKMEKEYDDFAEWLKKKKHNSENSEKAKVLEFHQMED